MRALLIAACSRGDAAEVQRLLDEHADNLDDVYLKPLLRSDFAHGCLHIAARRGHCDVLEALLAADSASINHRVDPDFDAGNLMAFEKTDSYATNTNVDVHVRNPTKPSSERDGWDLAMHRAAKRGHSEAVRVLLDAAPQHLTEPSAASDGTSVDQVIRKDAALRGVNLAAEGGHLSTLLLLVERIPLSRFSMPVVNYLLHAHSRATTSDASEITRVLLKLQQEVSGGTASPFDHIRPPEATCKGPALHRLDTISAILDLDLTGSDLDAVSKARSKCMRDAARCGDTQLVRMLLAAEPPAELGFATVEGQTYSMTYLLIACRRGHVDVVRVLLHSYFTSVEAGRSQVIDEAALVRLLACGAAGSNAASLREFMRLEQLPSLLGCRFSSEHLLERALHAATWSNRRSSLVPAVLELMPTQPVAAKARLAHKYLHRAARDGDAELLASLLQCPVVEDLDRRDVKGRSALHIASACNQAICVRVLTQLQPGMSSRSRHADVDANDADGCTPLHLAVQSHSCCETVLALLEAGADADIRNRDGHTPLRVACRDLCGRVEQLVAATTGLPAHSSSDLGLRDALKLIKDGTGDHVAAPARCFVYAIAARGYGQMLRAMLCVGPRRERTLGCTAAEVPLEVIFNLLDLRMDKQIRCCLDKVAPGDPRSLGVEGSFEVLHRVAFKDANVADLSLYRLKHLLEKSARTGRGEIIRTLLTFHPRDSEQGRDLCVYAREHLLPATECSLTVPLAAGYADVLRALLVAAVGDDPTPASLSQALTKALLTACFRAHADGVRVLLHAPWPGDSLSRVLVPPRSWRDGSVQFGDSNNGSHDCVLHRVLSRWISIDDDHEDDVGISDDEDDYIYPSDEELELFEVMQPDADAEDDASRDDYEDATHLRAGDDSKFGAVAPVVGELLAAGAAFSYLSGGAAPIHVVVSAARVDVLRVMLQFPGQLELRDDNGDSALHLAVKAYTTTTASKLDAVQMLLAAHAAEGVSIDLLNKQWYTPAYEAACAGRPKMLQLLAQAGAKTDIIHPVTGENLLHAAACGDTGREGDVARVVLESAAPPDVLWRSTAGATAVHHAASLGRERLLRALLDARPGLLDELQRAPCDIRKADTATQTPLFLAAGNGHAPIVRLLLAAASPGSTHIEDAGASLEIAGADSVTALMAASARGLSTARLILASDPGACKVACPQKRLPLHYAARYGHADIVRAIVAASSGSVDAQDAYGCTPIKYAVQHGHWPVVKELLAEGADAGQDVPHGRSLLSEAMARGCDERRCRWIAMKLIEADRNTGHFQLISRFLSPKSWAARFSYLEQRGGKCLDERAKPIAARVAKLRDARDL